MFEPSQAAVGSGLSVEVEAGASVFDWGLAALSAVATWVFVWRFGPDLPIWDDFDVVQVAVGGRRATLDWFWALHNEHRVPLPKLILLLLYRGSGNNFRAGMFFSVAILAALAGGALRVASRRPGGARVYDGLLPLVLLNLSQHVNLLWSWQIQLVLSTVIAGGMVLLIVSRPGWPGPSRAALGAVGLTALCACGANGVALVPALATWLVVGSVVHWKGGQRRAGLASLAAAALGLVVTVLYFSGYHGATNHPATTGIAAAARTSFQFLALLFGAAAADFWPAAGLTVLVLIGASVLVTAWAALLGPADGRPRAIGLLFAFGAMGSLVLGLGWGRAGSGDYAGLEPRYVTLVTPLWLIIFFAWDLHTSPAVRRVVLTGLFSCNLVLLWPETRAGIEDGRQKAAQAARFVRDVRDGVPLYLLTRRHTPYLHPSQDIVARELATLRGARVGIFGSIRSDPVFHEVKLPVDPADVRLARWQNGTAHVTGIDAELHYVLPRSQPVAGVRLRYTHTNASRGPARFHITWSSVAGTPPGVGQRYANWALPTGKNQVTVIWIADTVKEFWIQPDNQRCDFTVEGLTLLIP